MAGKNTDRRGFGNRTLVPDLDGCVVRSGIEEVRGIVVGIGDSIEIATVAAHPDYPAIGLEVVEVCRCNRP